jgi:hypothetical protein
MTNIEIGDLVKVGKEIGTVVRIVDADIVEVAFSNPSSTVRFTK